MLRTIIPTGHTFEGQCTARLRKLDTAIGGSSKDVTLRIFSSSELVVAVALREEAK